ncbi:kinase-like domain-containing protein [Triangularia verruculosa]|uniref:EKC/KEOPS complex subunit BUD32 n=1 Tax=Triangularia verruculosa TaxID=2587418 RepID=A0AAN6X5B1_9PEZI|nr:kinase-like domain-containing protein [Triangularia verruculosa]
MTLDFKYSPSNIDYIEDLEKYQPNGFHPVHLGDQYDKVESGGHRYEVIHKLGFGGFSTVWLAHGLIDEGYVALKIISASQSSYGVTPAVTSILESHPAKIFVTELRRFLISGPNGELSVRQLARQAAQGLEFLHARGLCHGDFRVNNLVLALAPSFYQRSKDELLNLLGPPIRDPILAYGGNKTGSAPDYVVEPADLTKLGPSYLTDILMVVDFDQLFGFQVVGEQPLPAGIPPNPGFNVGIPINYLAPEGTGSTLFCVLDKNVLPNWANVECGFPHIARDEVAQLLDLLRIVFEYDTTKRVTAAEIVTHLWLAREGVDGGGTS